MCTSLCPIGGLDWASGLGVGLGVKCNYFKHSKKRQVDLNMVISLLVKIVLSSSGTPKAHHLVPPSSSYHSRSPTSRIRIVVHIVVYPHHRSPYIHSTRHDCLEALAHHFLFINHLGNASAVAVHDDAGFAERGLDGTFCLEDFAQFFKGASACFDEEEVDEDEFEYVPEDE